MSIKAWIKRALRIGSRVNNSTSGSLVYIDSNNKLAEDNSNLNWDDSGKNLGIGVATPTSKLHLPQENDATTPTLSFGDGNTGFYESADNILRLSIVGNIAYTFTSQGFSTGASDPRATMRNIQATATDPVFSFGGDTDTGVGTAGSDNLSLITGGKEGHRITETTAGNDSLQHTVNGLLGQATGDEIAYSFNYTVNKATSGDSYGPIVTLTDTASPGTNTLFGTRISATFYFAIRETSTSGDTWLMIYDVDNGTMERVTVGAADSGGAGYKVLRIPN